MFENIQNVLVYQNEPLYKYSTFRIGGPAEYVVVVQDEDRLVEVIERCVSTEKKFKIIGRGSNLLFADKGYDGVVIVNRTNQLNREGDKVEVSSGININTLNIFCAKNGLSGLEFSFGVPSTIAGAIHNNLGCFNHSISELIDSVKIFDGNDLIVMQNEDCQFDYRKSIFTDKELYIISAILKFDYDIPEKIKMRMQNYFEQKSKSQPLDMPSAGSIFKRTGDAIPSKLIDELGLKGTRIGGAMISTKHAGFIVNVDNAKSDDVLALIKLIEERIFFNYNVLVQTEIEYVI